MTLDTPDNDGEITSSERDLFDKLPREFAVSAGFERRLLNTLNRQETFLGSRSRVAHIVRWLGLAAAAAAIFLVGRQTGQTGDNLAVDDATFAFFLYEGADFQPETQTNYAERYSAYSQWVAELSRSNQFVTGLDLDGEGVVIQANSSTMQGNPVAPEGSMGSMFLVRAGTYDEAVRLAQGLPHLGYGGRVAIRRIVPVVTPEEFGAPE